jgi:hypothetical protein
VQFLTAENVPPIGIHRRIKVVYGEGVLFQRWAASVRDGMLEKISLSASVTNNGTKGHELPTAKPLALSGVVKHRES